MSGNKSDAGINVTSYNQSGGITAQNVTINARRSVRVDAENLLLGELAQLPKRSIRIHALIFDADGRALANALKHTFEKAGWSVEPRFYEAPGFAMNDILFGVPSGELQSRTAKAIHAFLVNNGFKIVNEPLPQDYDLDGYAIAVGEES